MIEGDKMGGTKRGKLKRCSGKIINKKGEIVRCKNRCRVNKNIITAYCSTCKKPFPSVNEFRAFKNKKRKQVKGWLSYNE